ncbi:MAG: ribonuclease III [Anaerolineales bacterium]|nr:ribonuclease III [Anaerolineales bacterium]MCB0010758.1 ribonuclease III [Anaerolineales bacterium]MCB0017508.1 ribonuclease III [Anaerolineales bacterium]MCB0029219.1 ribonuclease III [Anaerolineales bacterium]MCB8959171.1 ribonuclease III [Ardenticatenales bacterium]
MDIEEGRPVTNETEQSLAELEAFEARLGLTFQDRKLLLQALTHRSFINENPDDELGDNERLEFLGDAVLDFVVASYLYRTFPDKDEGELTALRAALVRSESLAGFARQIIIGPHLRLGFGEAESGGRDRTPTLCAAFEALVGAIYLDQGLEPILKMVEILAEPALRRIQARRLHKDAKSDFQVWAQGMYNITPHYNVISADGPDHAKIFTVEACLNEDVWGVGTGRSKQAAAQAAASEALAKAYDTVDENL